MLFIEGYGQSYTDAGIQGRDDRAAADTALVRAAEQTARTGRRTGAYSSYHRYQVAVSTNHICNAACYEYAPSGDSASGLGSSSPSVWLPPPSSGNYKQQVLNAGISAVFGMLGNSGSTDEEEESFTSYRQRREQERADAAQLARRAVEEQAARKAAEALRLRLEYERRPAQPSVDFALGTLGREKTEEEIRNEIVLRDLGRSSTPLSREAQDYLRNSGNLAQARGSAKLPSPFYLSDDLAGSAASGSATANPSRGSSSDALGFGGQVARGTVGSLSDQLLTEVRSGSHSASWTDFARDALKSTISGTASATYDSAREQAFNRASADQQIDWVAANVGAGGIFNREGMKEALTRVKDMGDKVLADLKQK